jgi:hypothetical protein
VQVREDRQQIQEDLERFTQDMLYFDQHRDELLRQYPDRWVAVYHQQVIGAAKDLKRLVRQLERKGIPAGRAFCEYLTDEETLLIV